MGNTIRTPRRPGRSFALKNKQKHRLRVQFVAFVYGQADEFRIDPELVRAALRRGHTALLWPVRAELQQRYRKWLLAWAKRARVSHMTVRRELNRVDLAELRRAS